MKYPAKFEPADEGGFVVTFRDIPEAITQGDTEEESLAMAEDALLTAMDFYFEDNRAVPPPSAIQERERMVEVPSSISAKILSWNESIEQRIGTSELKK